MGYTTMDVRVNERNLRWIRFTSLYKYRKQNQCLDLCLLLCRVYVHAVI